MKKLSILVLTALTLGALSAPASAADPLNTLACGLIIVPANCTPAERILGGAIVGAGFGFGVGAIVGASGGAISGGALAAHGTGAVAGVGAVIGGAAGAGTGMILARRR